MILAVVYTLWSTRSTFSLLNLYGLFTVMLGISVCMWVWHQGERYGKLIFLGFLPLYFAYPFAALRAAGIITDNWLSQYAVLIGSAIEIPLLLYVLHMRAKELSENKARMRAIDQTDPLTGLAIEPVLTLRVRDALLRGTSAAKARTILLVDLANHADISRELGHSVGDRALVMGASCLVSSVGQMDTVCRIDTARFAMLVESPLDHQGTVALAQRIVVLGLAEHADSRQQHPLRFRVVTSKLIAAQIPSNADQQALDLQTLLAPSIQAMNQLLKEPKRAIMHLNHDNEFVRQNSPNLS